MSDFLWGFGAGVIAILSLLSLLLWYMLRDEQPTPSSHVRDLELTDTRTQLDMIRVHWEAQSALHSHRLHELQHDLDVLREQTRNLELISSAVDEVIEKNKVSDD